MSDVKFLAAAPAAARAPLASDLVMAGDLAFISGLGPIDLANDETALPEMVERQALKILNNAEALLAKVGMSRDNIVSVRIYASNFQRHAGRINQAYAGFFKPDRLPARDPCRRQPSRPRGAGRDGLCCTALTRKETTAVSF